VLGFWAAATEGAKFWLSVLTDLKNRGVQDVLVVCADGVSGMKQAIEAAFPNAVHQTCVVHLIRSALRFVSYKDRKPVTAALRDVYGADSEEAAEAALTAVEKQFNAQYPSIGRTFRDRWEEFVPFLSYPPEVRRMLYTTNAVESLNSQLRKVLRQRGPLPNDEAVFKLLFLAIRNAKVHWRRPVTWSTIVTQLDIFFEGRLPA
jgi:putative transposase